MEFIEILFNYRGALIEAEIRPEEDCKGMLYPIHLNGGYSFTISYNEDEEEWSIMRESDGTIPAVEDELFKIISKQLKWELMHAV